MSKVWDQGSCNEKHEVCIHIFSALGGSFEPVKEEMMNMMHQLKKEKPNKYQIRNFGPQLFGKKLHFARSAFGLPCSALVHESGDNCVTMIQKNLEQK